MDLLQEILMKMLFIILMTRGIELPKAKKLLINGFLNDEIFENIRRKN